MATFSLSFFSHLKSDMSNESYADSKNVNFDLYLAVWVSKLDGPRECGRSRAKLDVPKVQNERIAKVNGSEF